MRVEHVHIIVRDEPGAGHDEPGAESTIDRLGHRHDIAVAVSDGEVRRVGGFRQRNAGIPIPGLFHVDVRPTLVRVGFRQETLDGHVDESRIGRCLLTIREGDLQYLRQQMQVLRRPEAEFAHAKTFEQVEHLHNVDAAGRGRRRTDDFVVAIGASYNVAFDRRIVGEIVHRQQSAGLLKIVGYGAAEAAAIEDVRSFRGDGLQRFGIVPHDQPRTSRERRAVRQKDLRDFRITRQVRGSVSDALVEVRRHRVAPRRMCDRRRHRIRQRYRPETFEDLAPRHQIAGSSDGLRSDSVLPPLCFQIIR